MYDLNDTEPMRTSEIIPDGSFAKVIMTIRPGGVDGPFEIDRGLLKPSTTADSDVLSLDCEFTVTDGPHARRKFWHSFTVSGGKVDEKGVSVGWNISKRIFRAMIDSAFGLDPSDMSDVAKTKRQLRGLVDFDGIAFVAKVTVETSDRYGDKNRLDRPVLPNEKEWPLVMEGKDAPPRPSQRKKENKSADAQAKAQPAWNRPATTTPTAPAAAPATSASAPPAWKQTAAPTSGPESSQPAAKAAGPAWLNG